MEMLIKLFLFLLGIWGGMQAFKMIQPVVANA